MRIDFVPTRTKISFRLSLNAHTPRYHTCTGDLWGDRGPGLFDLALVVRVQRQLHRLREREPRLRDPGRALHHAYHQHELFLHINARLQAGVRATRRQASVEIKRFRFPDGSVSLS